MLMTYDKCVKIFLSNSVYFACYFILQNNFHEYRIDEKTLDVASYPIDAYTMKREFYLNQIGFVTNIRCYGAED